MNRLFQQVQAMVVSGELAPGQELPPVTELQKRLDASREEVEQALSELIYEGVLERVRRAPEPDVRVPGYKLWGTLGGIHSVTHEARKRNQQPGTEVLFFDIVPGWPSVARRLQLDTGDEVVIMERLRTADGDPVAIETSYMPAKLMPGITRDMFLDKGAGQSSFEVMQKKFGLKSKWAADELTVAAVEAREAALIGVEPGTPILVRFRITYSDQDVPIKCSRAIWKFKAGYRMELDE